jgi:hypothetical protein
VRAPDTSILKFRSREFSVLTLSSVDERVHFEHEELGSNRTNHRSLVSQAGYLATGQVLVVHATLKDL